jgi:hypothetical protein
MEVSEIFMTYIAKSNKHPLGKVEHIWWRHEYQSAKANLSHIHALIRLADTESEAAILDRIRGMIGDLIRSEEAEQFIAEGVLKDMDDYFETKDMARRVLQHSCTERCLKRTGPGETDLRCHSVCSHLDSADPTRHCMQTIHVFHSPAAIKVMAELGLCEPIIHQRVQEKALFHCQVHKFFLRQSLNPIFSIALHTPHLGIVLSMQQGLMNMTIMFRLV